MNAFRVENMTCGHCVRTIETAIHAVDASAKVDVDLAAGIVRIEGGTTDPLHLASAIGKAGYRASRIDADVDVDADANAVAVADTGSARRGCCCG